MDSNDLKESVDQQGMVANSGRGQFSLSLFAPENLVSRDEFGRHVPFRVSPRVLYTQADSGAYSRDPPCFPRRRLLIPSIAIGSIPSLSGFAIACR